MVKKFFSSSSFFLTALFCFGVLVQSAELYSPNPEERQQALIEIAGRGRRAVPHLGAALYDEDAAVRRKAAKIITGMDRPVLELINAAVMNSDAFVSLSALLKLEELGSMNAEALIAAMGNENQLVHQEAARILSERKITIIGMEKVWEHVRSFRLPAGGWKFRLDPDGKGQDEGWYRPDYPDNDWDSIGIERAWQAFGYSYVGEAWYRNSFLLPDRIDADGVELHFGGVDESAWVWINGEYAGEHDIGPIGWDIPFSLDITDMIRWGEKNHIAVKAMNTTAAGGIWRPVTINFLR